MPERDAHDDEPTLVFLGGSDTLQLEEGGKVYLPGDPLPKNLSQARRVSLQSAGIRIETRHDEPVLAPDGTPDTHAAAGQIDPPPGSPAVIAAVEDVPKQEPAPARTAKKGD